MYIEIFFLLVIQEKRILPNQEAMMLMREVKDGRFLVKLSYMTLVQPLASLFPFRFVWIPWVPTKVCSFFLGSLLV